MKKFFFSFVITFLCAFSLFAQIDLSGEWCATYYSYPHFILQKDEDDYLVKQKGETDFGKEQGYYKSIGNNKYQATWNSAKCFFIVDINNIQFTDAQGQKAMWTRYVPIKDLEQPYKNVVSNGTVTGSQGLDNLIGLAVSVGGSSSNNSSSSSNSPKTIRTFDKHVCVDNKVTMYEIEDPKHPNISSYTKLFFYWSGGKCVGEKAGWYEYDSNITYTIYNYYGTSLEEAVKERFK